jgi:hypothetical protein
MVETQTEGSLAGLNGASAWMTTSSIAQLDGERLPRRDRAAFE